ncbi:MAG: cytochrome c, partial [Alphaproteobacteria bacterium]|nr:cytochrome c [Alphaproteobacteria bacterium]
MGDRFYLVRLAAGPDHGLPRVSDLGRVSAEIRLPPDHARDPGQGVRPQWGGGLWIVARAGAEIDRRRPRRPGEARLRRGAGPEFPYLRPQEPARVLQAAGRERAVSLLAALLTFASTAHAQPRTDVVATLYAEHCAVCHGDNLQGAAQGTPLIGIDLAGGATVSAIAASTAKGSTARGMPAWGETLSADQIHALALFITERRQGTT